MTGGKGGRSLILYLLCTQVMKIIITLRIIQPVMGNKRWKSFTFVFTLNPNRIDLYYPNANLSFYIACERALNNFFRSRSSTQKLHRIWGTGVLLIRETQNGYFWIKWKCKSPFLLVFLWKINILTRFLSKISLEKIFFSIFQYHFFIFFLEKLLRKFSRHFQ